jgi:hypothetical protein
VPCSRRSGASPSPTSPLGKDRRPGSSSPSPDPRPGSPLPPRSGMTAPSPRCRTPRDPNRRRTTAIRGGAGNLFSDKGFGGDDGHLMALFGQPPGGADPAPVRPLVIQNHLVARPRLAPQDGFGGVDMAASSPGRRGSCGSQRWKPSSSGSDPVARITVSAGWAAISSSSRKVFSRSVTPSFVELAFVPVHQVQDLCPPRLHGPPAGTARRSPARPRRSPRHGRARRRPARPPAPPDRRRPPAPCGGGGGEAVAAPFEFAARRGVDQAGNPVIARPPAPAHLVARNAAANILGPALHHLARQMRVGDLAAHDRHQIGLARAQDRFGVVGGADAGLGGDFRMLHHAFSCAVSGVVSFSAWVKGGMMPTRIPDSCRPRR